MRRNFRIFRDLRGKLYGLFFDICGSAVLPPSFLFPAPLKTSSLVRIIFAAVVSVSLAGCASYPEVSSFYQVAPGPLRGRPGDLIRTEPIPGAPSGATAVRILYLSTGVDGSLIPVSAVVIFPTAASASGPRKVVAWGHATSGIATACAPSLYEGRVFATVPGLKDLLARGYVVTATDYPGLGAPGPHPYLVGLTGGRSVIDSVRAVRRLPAANAGSRFVAWGHSQGGQAALFAGEIARSYAPELNLVGVVAVSPATDLSGLLRANNESLSGRLFAAYCLSSWSKVYGAPLDPLATPEMQRAVANVASDCTKSPADAIKLSVDLLGLRSGFPVRDGGTIEPWRSLLARNNPGQTRVGVPIFVAQGTSDEIVRPVFTNTWVSAARRRGETVRYVTLEDIAHLLASDASAATARSWVEDRFAGKPAPNDNLLDNNYHPGRGRQIF